MKLANNEIPVNQVPQMPCQQAEAISTIYKKCILKYAGKTPTVFTQMDGYACSCPSWAKGEMSKKLEEVAKKIELRREVITIKSVAELMDAEGVCVRLLIDPKAHIPSAVRLLRKAANALELRDSSVMCFVNPRFIDLDEAFFFLDSF